MIEKYNFGRIVINGQTFSKDLKIIQGKIIHPWQRDKGHNVDQKDITDVLKANPEIFILGKGKPGMMKSTANLRQILSQEGIKLIEEPTAKAVQSFNQLLKQGRDVAAGLHLTC